MEKRRRPGSAYGWYNGEKTYGVAEVGKRKGASLVFAEQIVREVRRGGRTNLIATIDVPDLPEREVTIVSTHLENRTTPKGRVKEADELLDIDSFNSESGHHCGGYEYVRAG